MTISCIIYPARHDYVLLSIFLMECLVFFAQTSKLKHEKILTKQYGDRHA